MKHEDRYIWLDFVRGLSALLVSLMHLRHYVMVEYHDIAHPTLLMKLVYFVSSLGHVAVMVFFVMSGFFVGGSLLNRGRDFSWANYLIARISRLWVVLIPALALTLIVDCYLMPADYVTQPKNIEAHTLSVLLGNLFFLQNIYFTEYGSNLALWSLANEFWYYIVFPLILFTFGYLSKNTCTAHKVFAGLVALIIMFEMPQTMRLGLLVWLVGFFIYFVVKKQETRNKKQETRNKKQETRTHYY